MVQENVLSHLKSDENSVTTLLRALCVLKPIRDIVIRIFTKGRFSADDVEFEGISMQLNIGGSIPDICVENNNLRISVEIKTSDWRGLTANQPHEYLKWLGKGQVNNKFFVFLTTPHYSPQHRKEYDARKNNFCLSNPQHGITFVEIDWLDIFSAFKKTGLSSSCIYARDFENLLKQWYLPSPIKFTNAELQVTDMFNTTAPSAISKIFEFIVGIADKFKQEGFIVRENFQKRFWDGEYGIYIYCVDKPVLWLGLDMSFWKVHGSPLCFGVSEVWASPQAILCFKSIFPGHARYPNDPERWLIQSIEQSLLMDNAVKDVSDMLLKGYLNGICSIIDGKKSE